MTKYLLIGLLIFTIVFTIVNRIRFHSPKIQERLKAAKKEREERYRNYTGRAEGKIIEHHWETYLKSGVGTGRTMKEDTIDATDSVFYVTYEFEVDGQTYVGKGEGSPAFQVRKYQTICYDPSDPNLNCTLFYLDSYLRSIGKSILHE